MVERSKLQSGLNSRTVLQLKIIYLLVSVSSYLLSMDITPRTNSKYGPKTQKKTSENFLDLVSSRNCSTSMVT